MASAAPEFSRPLKERIRKGAQDLRLVLPQAIIAQEPVADFLQSVDVVAEESHLQLVLVRWGQERRICFGEDGEGIGSRIPREAGEHAYESPEDVVDLAFRATDCLGFRPRRGSLQEGRVDQYRQDVAELR